MDALLPECFAAAFDLIKSLVIAEQHGSVHARNEVRYLVMRAIVLNFKLGSMIRRATLKKSHIELYFSRLKLPT
jgi:hypothetical protein